MLSEGRGEKREQKGQGDKKVTLYLQTFQWGQKVQCNARIPFGRPCLAPEKEIETPKKKTEQMTSKSNVVFIEIIKLMKLKECL